MSSAAVVIGALRVKSELGDIFFKNPLTKHARLLLNPVCIKLFILVIFVHILMFLYTIYTNEIKFLN